MHLLLPEAPSLFGFKVPAAVFTWAELLPFWVLAARSCYRGVM